MINYLVYELDHNAQTPEKPFHSLVGIEATDYKPTNLLRNLSVAMLLGQSRLAPVWHVTKPQMGSRFFLVVFFPVFSWFLSPYALGEAR